MVWHSRFPGVGRQARLDLAARSRFAMTAATAKASATATATATGQNRRLTLNDLGTPAFVVNRRAFRENCERVRTSAHANGIFRLRPHVKTHKTREECLIQAGLASKGGDGPSEAAAAVIGFVASTLPELAMVTDLARRDPCMPFNDILFGIPVCRSKLSGVQRLSDKLASATNNGGIIHLLVDHPKQVSFLEEFVREHSSRDRKWSVFLKLDTGYHRAGTTCDFQGASLAKDIVRSPYLTLKGLYSHCGHAYDIEDSEAMKDVAACDHIVIFDFLALLKEMGIDTESLDISVGSTPSLFHHQKLPLDIPNNIELHPGNYVFYDRQQLYTGACPDESSIAAYVLARVIGHYEDANRHAIMVDAGATALTKEVTPQGDVCAVFGRPELECYRMSQEVTMIRSRGDDPFPFEDFPLGSMILLLPNHSCLAAACFDVYHVVDDGESPLGTDSKIVDTWKPSRGWVVA